MFVFSKKRNAKLIQICNNKSLMYTNMISFN